MKRTAHIAAGQFFFFSLFFWYFVHNSFLRPKCSATVENCLALIIIAAMAINYWILYPFVYKKHSFWLYAIISVVVASLCAFTEYILTIDAALSILPAEIMQVQSRHVKYMLFLNCLLRDTCLVGFAGLMADNLGQKFRLLETDRLLLRRKGQILVQQNGKDHLIDAVTISYVKQCQNYTFVFTNDGQHYSRHGTLHFFEQAPEDLHGVKISRNTIVFMPYVTALSDKEVTVITMESPLSYEYLPLGKSAAPSAILKIERYLHQKETVETSVKGCFNERSEPPTVVEDAELMTNKKTESLLSANPGKQKKDVDKGSVIREYISRHPDCNLNDIVSGTHIPKSTASRYLKDLQSRNIIKYIGSKKTGGYRLMAKQKPFSNQNGPNQ